MLEVGITDFIPTNASVTYTEGSMERWSVDSARSEPWDLAQLLRYLPLTNLQLRLR